MPHLGHHEELILEVADNPIHPRYDPIYDENLYAAFSFEEVLIFLEVKEFLIEDLLPHHFHLLEQIRLEGSGNRLPGPHTICGGGCGSGILP